jgi:hypothetical protein
MVPPVLATACLLTIFAGQILTINSAPSLINDFPDRLKVARDFQAQIRDACPNVAPEFLNRVDEIILFNRLPKSDKYSDLLSECNTLKLLGLTLVSVADADSILFYPYAVCVAFLVWLALRRYSRAPQHAYARVESTAARHRIV